MDSTIAQLPLSQLPVLFAAFAGAVGLIGCGAAVAALTAIARERKAIGDSSVKLASSEAWEGGHGVSEMDLSTWLREKEVDLDSGIADVIRVCWSAWLGSRAATLTEIHVLVARRERSKLAAKLSGGIAALLLVIGIVGTLWSVHPVLKAFQFRVSSPTGSTPVADGPALVNVAESTELVNALMSNLGDAFMPSLAALVSTIVVVALRGLYSLGLHRYTLELDRFAMGIVMPRYRPRSISEEFDEVRETFQSLANSIQRRDEKFDRLTDQVSHLVKVFGPTVGQLDIATSKISGAADSLSARANSIATTLTRTLGRKSPLFAAVDGFEGIFQRTNDEIIRLGGILESAEKSSEEVRQKAAASVDRLAQAVESVGHAHKEDRDKVSAVVVEVKSLVSELPIEVTEVTRDIVRSGLEKIGTSFDLFLRDQKEEVETTQKELRESGVMVLEATNSSLSHATNKFEEAARSLPKALDRIDAALTKSSEMESLANKAIRSVAEEAKSMIKALRVDSDLSGERTPGDSIDSAAVPLRRDPSPTIELSPSQSDLDTGVDFPDVKAAKRPWWRNS